MARFQELLRSLNNLKLLGAIGRSGGDLANVADLVDNFLGSPQMQACVQRFRALPGGAELMDRRYPPLQPDIDRLIALPPGTLGRRYAELIRQLGYDPEFFRPRPTDTDERWLTQRIATTHDIHHVVAGFTASPRRPRVSCQPCHGPVTPACIDSRSTDEPSSRSDPGDGRASVSSGGCRSTASKTGLPWPPSPRPR